MTASSEIKSEHPIAQTIVKKAKEEKIALLEVSEFDTMIGHGIMTKYNQKRISVTNPPSNKNMLKSINENSLSQIRSKIPKEMESKITELELEGKTVVQSL
jgi:cation transport ATPase